jgi:hypothetical protein
LRHLGQQQSLSAPIVDGKAFPVVRTAKVGKEAARILVEVQKSLSTLVEDARLPLLDTLFASDLVEKTGYRNQILRSRMLHLRPPVAEYRILPRSEVSPINGSEPTPQTHR